MRHHHRATALLFLAATMSFACAKTNNNETAADTATVAPTPAPAVAGPTDAQIAHIVVTANTIDIE
jgi:predicted outer membrane protein